MWAQIHGKSRQQARAAIDRLQLGVAVALRSRMRKQKEKRGFWLTSDLKRRNPNKIIKILWVLLFEFKHVSNSHVHS